jgi:branched-chain amino acid transport system substrate-binding protein
VQGASVAAVRARAPLPIAVLVALALPAGAAGQAQLTVYSSLPHSGASKAESDHVLRGATMALEERGGQVAGRPVRLVSLDGARRGSWDPARTAANARTAADDTSAIAYLGELNSGASAISAPITNAAGLLQVSPSNAYVGLTRRVRGVTDRGEPGRYMPSGRRTFGRVAATDRRQAAAMANYLDALGVRRVVLVDDREVYGAGLAVMLRGRLRERGIAIARRAALRGDGRQVARSLRGVRADAMVYCGIVANGAVRLWRAVHRRHRRWRLLGADGVATPAFARAIGAGAARRTRLTAPPLAESAYGAAGQAFFARFRARYGSEPHPFAIYGYEAMAVILDSAAATADPANRGLVVDAFYATRDRDSVLGRYSIDAFGDTTLGTYGGYRVDGRGRIVWDRVLRSGAG